MRAFHRSEFAALVGRHQSPCVTICMPTHRRPPESHQHPVQYANLVREAAGVLDKKFSRRNGEVAALVEKLEHLGGPDLHPDGLSAFWAHQKDGLAVFASPGHFAIYCVPLPLRNIVVAADTYHVKPLLPLLYNSVRFHVLALTRNEVTLYEGNAERLEPLPQSGIPRSLVAALGEETTDTRADRAAHGGAGGPGAGKAYHGYGKGSDDDKEELRRYFRAVDRAVDERYSKVNGLPLILCAVDYYHPLYREVAHDRHLLSEGVLHDPRGLTPAQVHEHAWKIFERMHQRRVKEAVEEIGAARAHHAGSTDLEEIARAAVSGRIRRLLVEEKRRIWGRLNRDTGEVALGGAQGNPDDVDVLDDLAEVTLLHGGDVLLVPRADLPTDAGVAATFRF
jgi:hypothetical protein